MQSKKYKSIPFTFFDEIVIYCTALFWHELSLCQVYLIYMNGKRFFLKLNCLVGFLFSDYHPYFPQDQTRTQSAEACGRGTPCTSTAPASSRTVCGPPSLSMATSSTSQWTTHASTEPRNCYIINYSPNILQSWCVLCCCTHFNSLPLLFLCPAVRLLRLRRWSLRIRLWLRLMLSYFCILFLEVFFHLFSVLYLQIGGTRFLN